MTKKLLPILKIALGLGLCFLIYHLYSEHAAEVSSWYISSKSILIRIVVFVGIIGLAIAAYSFYKKTRPVEAVITVPLASEQAAGTHEKEIQTKVQADPGNIIEMVNPFSKGGLRLILTHVIIDQPGGFFTMVAVLGALHWIKLSPILDAKDLHIMEAAMGGLGLVGALVLFASATEKNDPLRPASFGFLVLLFATTWNFI